MSYSEEMTQYLKRRLIINNVICYILLGISGFCVIFGYSMNIISQINRWGNASLLQLVDRNYTIVLITGLVVFAITLVYKCIFKKIALYYIDLLKRED